ncbi:PREDICTED: putative F-box protein At3g58950 [Camelina sativa]|uniref:F-box protein At3g58950 n=1 Tax=Camelina sativa TaxID=90675 RepID=A0ABM0ZCD4_CAMSA|nr:PREDICTED: putative F-box protein At3g58950 [Camelina sativa]
MEIFLRSVPVLEELSIDATVWIVCDETVSSETLRKLTIYSYGFEYLLSLKSISFDTPRLVYFDYSDYVAEDYPKVNLTNVVEALLNLRLTEDQYRQARAARDDQDDVLLRFRNVWKLLSGLRAVQKLYLSCYTLEALSLCCESIPVFNNLKVLRISSYKDQGWQAMPVLLMNCPLLETLVLEV